MKSSLISKNFLKKEPKIDHYGSISLQSSFVQSITRREDFKGELHSPLKARSYILSGEKLHLFFIGQED